MQIEPPGQARVRIKVSPQWHINRDAQVAWVTYMLPGGLGPQVLKVQYPRASKRPAWVIQLTDEQQLFLTALLETGQTPLPGRRVYGGGCCDGALIELSLSTSAISASYSWDGEPPEAWEDLGQIVDFVTGLADEVDQS